MGETRPRVLAHAGWVLGGSIAEAASLRKLVSEALPEGCARRADVELAARELAVNAATHSRAGSAGGLAAELTVTPQRVELAVHDPGGGDRPRLASPPDPLADPDLPAEAFEHGRGLALVNACADGWGYTGDGNGCLVWVSFNLIDSSSDEEHGGEGRSPDEAVPHSGSDFPGPGGITRPPENVLAYLLGQTTGGGPDGQDRATP